MNTTRMPVFFLSHGGGPWPWIERMRAMFAKTEREWRRLPDALPARPKAVLVVTAHWEAPEFTVSTAATPPMVYDYSGFPEHTYGIRYPAPGSPDVAERVGRLLAAAGIPLRQDATRGFDHGTFVPLALMFPEADVPVVSFSIKSSLDPREHLAAGRALAPLRDEGVLILGSGLTYHDMRGFGREASAGVASRFEAFLNAAVTAPAPAVRDERLANWRSAPDARAAHPREDHLIPLMVAAGAAGDDLGRCLFVDHAMGVDMGSYAFGDRDRP